jgi:hypothetical protein
MSRYHPPKITPLTPIETPITTAAEARAQMIEDSSITRGNVLAQMDIPDDKRAELEATLALFSQMLIGSLDDETALETFK